MKRTGTLHLNMPRADYDAITHRVNWSTLKAMGRSPLHYRHGLTNKRGDTPALALGRAIHVAVLEPHLFAAEYAVWGGGRRQGKEWDAFCAANRDREILTKDEADRCAAIYRAVRDNAHAGKYVVGGSAEATVLWTHETPAIAGLDGFTADCKARLDYVRPDALVDLKTTRDASPDGFGRTAWNFQYHVQAAMYVDGYAAATGRELPFVIIAVETEPPHVVQVYRVPDHVLDLGRETYRALLARRDWCMRTNEWTGYGDGELDLTLPRWAATFDDDNDLADTGLTFGGE